jgi:hypothetical protein
VNPVNVARVVNNPAFQRPFQILRSSYAMRNEGEWTLVATQIFNLSGGIRPTSTADRVAFLPEGQRQVNAITIYSTVPILQADGHGQESDVIIWNGNYYRVQFSKPYQSYFYSIATGFVASNAIDLESGAPIELEDGSGTIDLETQ